VTVLAIIERSLCNAKKDCKRDRWGHSASCDAAGGAGEQVGLEGDGGFVMAL
jgi:hypothetical protein